KRASTSCGGSLSAVVIVRAAPLVKRFAVRIERSARSRRETREREQRVGRPVVANQTREHLAERRSHLEAVTAAAAGNPDFRQAGVTVDEEVSVGAVLVLTDLGAEERRAGERRKAPVHERPHRLLALGRRT